MFSTVISDCDSKQFWIRQVPSRHARAHGHHRRQVDTSSQPWLLWSDERDSLLGLLSDPWKEKENA